MSAYDVERAYAAWARAAQFVEYEGEPSLHGTIDGHGVRVDDGTRGDRCYPIDVWVEIEITEPRGIVHRRRAETTPVRKALRRVMVEEKPLTSVRVDERELAVGFAKGTEPEEMARITTRLIRECRLVVPDGGVYR